MTGRANPEPDALLQIMDVSEFHMLAAQELSPTRIWAEWSAEEAMFDPRMVLASPPRNAKFALWLITSAAAGESYDKPCERLLNTPDMVIDTERRFPTPRTILHDKLVSETQCVLEHEERYTRPTLEIKYIPKFLPCKCASLIVVLVAKFELETILKAASS